MIYFSLIYIKKVIKLKEYFGFNTENKTRTHRLMNINGERKNNKSRTGNKLEAQTTYEYVWDFYFIKLNAYAVCLLLITF